MNNTDANLTFHAQLTPPLSIELGNARLARNAPSSRYANRAAAEPNVETRQNSLPQQKFRKRNGRLKKAGVVRVLLRDQLGKVRTEAEHVVAIFDIIFVPATHQERDA